MGIGEKLKEARIAKNLSLDDIQDETKIQKRYLQAIEEGNFHILPGSFYARAFIKEYAQVVGLDYESLVKAHEDELPAIGERRSEAQYTRIQRTRKSSGPSRAKAFLSFLPTLIVILLVFTIIGLAIYFINQKSFDPNNNNEQNEVNEFYRKNDNDRENEEVVDNNEEENEVNEEEIEEEEEVRELELQVVETNEGVSPPVTTFQVVHGEEQLTLSLESSGRSWLDVYLDGEREFADFIQEENSPLQYDITDLGEVGLNIGNASFVTVKINDVVLEYEVDEVAHVFQYIVLIVNDEEDGETGEEDEVDEQ